MSFQPVVFYNGYYLVLIGIVAFFTQLQLLHLLRYHKTISLLGATLGHALWDLISFGIIMGIIFFAFTSAIYLMYHELSGYSTMVTSMGSQVMTTRINVKRLYRQMIFVEDIISKCISHRKIGRCFRFRDAAKFRHREFWGSSRTSALKRG